MPSGPVVSCSTRSNASSTAANIRRPSSPYCCSSAAGPGLELGQHHPAVAGAGPDAERAAIEHGHRPCPAGPARRPRPARSSRRRPRPRRPRPVARRRRRRRPAGRRRATARSPGTSVRAVRPSPDARSPAPPPFSARKCTDALHFRAGFGRWPTVAGHGRIDRRVHLRQPHGARAAVRGGDGAAGGRARLPLVLDGRDHRPRGLLAAGRGRRRRPGPRPRHRRAGPPAPHPAAGRHVGRHALGPRPRPRRAARRGHLLPRRHVPLARRALRRPPARPGAGVRRPRAGVPVGREGHLRRRPLPGEGLPPRRPLRRGRPPARRSCSAPSGPRCWRWPARWPTACCSTTCRRRTSPGRSSRCGRARPPPGGSRGRAPSTPTSTPGSPTATAPWPTGARTSSPTPWSTPTPRASPRPASATRSTEVRERHAAGDREGALAAVSEEMVDAIDVVGDADLVRDTVRAYADAGVDHPVLMPLPWGPDRRQVVDDTMRAFVDGLAAGGRRLLAGEAGRDPRRRCRRSARPVTVSWSPSGTSRRSTTWPIPHSRSIRASVRAGTTRMSCPALDDQQRCVRHDLPGIVLLPATPRPARSSGGRS